MGKLGKTEVYEDTSGSKATAADTAKVINIDESIKIMFNHVS